MTWKMWFALAVMAVLGESHRLRTRNPFCNPPPRRWATSIDSYSGTGHLSQLASFTPGGAYLNQCHELYENH